MSSLPRSGDYKKNHCPTSPSFFPIFKNISIVFKQEMIQNSSKRKEMNHVFNKTWQNKMHSRPNSRHLPDLIPPSSHDAITAVVPSDSKVTVPTAVTDHDGWILPLITSWFYRSNSFPSQTLSCFIRIAARRGNLDALRITTDSYFHVAKNPRPRSISNKNCYFHCFHMLSSPTRRAE